MYRHILVPVDGSSTSARALQEALGLARQQTAELELVYVMEDVLFLENEAYIKYDEVHKSAKSEGEKMLAQAQAVVLQAGMIAEQRLAFTTTITYPCRLSRHSDRLRSASRK